MIKLLILYFNFNKSKKINIAISNHGKQNQCDDERIIPAHARTHAQQKRALSPSFFSGLCVLCVCGFYGKKKRAPKIQNTWYYSGITLFKKSSILKFMNQYQTA